jgi:hypothetical protein
MADEDYKYIYTKRRAYRLPMDARGIPIEEAFPGAEMPAFLKGALVYETPRRRIIARQESDEREGSAERKNTGAARAKTIGKDGAEAGRQAAEPPRSPAKPETPTGEPHGNPMRFFRKDALAQGNEPKTRSRPRDHDRDGFER